MKAYLVRLIGRKAIDAVIVARNRGDLYDIIDMRADPFVFEFTAAPGIALWSVPKRASTFALEYEPDGHVHAVEHGRWRTFTNADHEAAYGPD